MIYIDWLIIKGSTLIPRTDYRPQDYSGVGYLLSTSRSAITI